MLELLKALLSVVGFGLIASVLIVYSTVLKQLLKIMEKSGELTSFEKSLWSLPSIGAVYLIISIAASVVAIVIYTPENDLIKNLQLQTIAFICMFFAGALSIIAGGLYYKKTYE
ncbi:MAG: hypothetical protein ACE5J9_09360 [Methanosarcinales archaeon]